MQAMNVNFEDWQLTFPVPLASYLILYSFPYLESIKGLQSPVLRY
jgi:hypothetical protein